MDSFEINKIITAILLVVLLVFGVGKISDIIFKTNKPDIDGYKVEIKTSDKLVSKTSSESQVDIVALLAMGDVEHGKKVFKKCAACHSIAEGGANKIGPALWGVIGRKVGSVPDYKYSKAMAAHGKNWSFDEMNGFLIKPKDWIKGTKMSFAGLKNEKERAAVILYMNENSNSPLPLN